MSDLFKSKGDGARPLLSGGILGIASLPAYLMLQHVNSILLAALILVLIAGVYLGYAFSDGRWKIIATEGVVASVFLGAAFIGVSGWQWAIPIAFALHGLWDAAHHSRVGTIMPHWYIPFCAVYDWATAAGLCLIWLS